MRGGGTAKKPLSFINVRISFEGMKRFICTATILLSVAHGSAQQQTDSADAQTSPVAETLPIISYDTDVGLGYGVKLFLLDQLSWQESFDLVAFNSTKGERWYRFVFSLPDVELRQRTEYDAAFDLTIDYDKWIKNSFFGIGNAAAFHRREYYTREPLEVTLACSRGWRKSIVGHIGVKYKSVTNFNISDTSMLHLLPPINRGTATSFGITASFRYDSRNSYINPSGGTVLLAEGEMNPPTAVSNVSYSRAALWLQYYRSVVVPDVVVATRIGMQQLFGNDIPVQMLLPIGGNRTLRGSPQDRYLDKASIVLNGEVRFPLLWRFGGVAGVDAGKVWNALSRADLVRWGTNSVVGLRFSMDTFVVRADAGFGSDASGFYLNFGHLF